MYKPDCAIGFSQSTADPAFPTGIKPDKSSMAALLSGIKVGAFFKFFTTSPIPSTSHSCQQHRI